MTSAEGLNVEEGEDLLTLKKLREKKKKIHVSYRKSGLNESSDETGSLKVVG